MSLIGESVSFTSLGFFRFRDKGWIASAINLTCLSSQGSAGEGGSTAECVLLCDLDGDIYDCRSYGSVSILLTRFFF